MAVRRPADRYKGAIMKTKRRTRACMLAFLLGLPFTITAAGADDTVAITQRAIGSSLLSVDQHRETIVDGIVAQWGDKISATTAMGPAQLREALFALRSDRLLAASLAGTADALLDVMSPRASAAVDKEDVQTKALTNANADLTYVPVTPCRLVETRNAFAAVFQGGGPFSPGEIRTYTIQSGNGVCLTQLPPTVTPAAVQLQVFGIPRNGVSGDIEILPQGSVFGNTATLVFLGNNAFTSAGTTSAVSASRQISVQVRQGFADVAIDLVGYFRTPELVPQKQVFTYNLGPNGIGQPIPIPVLDTPVHVQAVNLTIGGRGVAAVTLLRCCSASAAFLEWTGLSSTAASAITQGFSGAVGTAITQIDFQHQVVLEVNDAASMRVHNTSSVAQFGVVTLTW
jgi:hypothetical protein